jgi:hypothetical protein
MRRTVSGAAEPRMSAGGEKKLAAAVFAGATGARAGQRDADDLRIVGGRLRRRGVANAYILPGLEDGRRRLGA